MDHSSRIARRTHLIRHILLKSSVLLDLLALLVFRGLTLVDRRSRDAGNSVLANLSASLPVVRCFTSCVRHLHLPSVSLAKGVARMQLIRWCGAVELSHEGRKLEAPRLVQDPGFRSADLLCVCWQLRRVTGRMRMRISRWD